MKKSIILMGFLGLFACTEDNVLEKEKLDKPRSLDISNTINSIDPVLPYNSPYGNPVLAGVGGGPYASPVEYVFNNETDFDLTIYPMVGLAYFDGQYDNKNFGWSMNPSLTPTLFSGNKEYLNIIVCAPLHFGPHSYETSKPGPQLPTVAGTIIPSGQFFDAPTLNSQENGLLYEGGKFYGMEIGVSAPAGSPPITGVGGWMKFRFLPEGVRDPRQISQDWLPLPANGYSANKDYWYNKKTFEICPGNNPNVGQGNIFSNVPSERYFSQNGIDYVLKAYTTSTRVIISFTKI